MALIRAMFVGQGPSGLPEDQVVNTFHFTTALGRAEGHTAIVGVLQDFYNGEAGQFHSISEWLGAWISRTAEIRTYDLADLRPREPMLSVLDLNASATGTSMPEEVAVCLSYSAAAPITPRRRGRIYVGPLSSLAVIAGSPTTNSRPDPAVLTDLGLAATRLADNAAGVSWVVLHRAQEATEDHPASAESTSLIVQGYVDNALDTQRRRGPKTTARTPWSVL